MKADYRWYCEQQYHHDTTEAIFQYFLDSENEIGKFTTGEIINNFIEFCFLVERDRCSTRWAGKYLSKRGAKPGLLLWEFDVNTMWGHRSISIDSNLGALQHFFVFMVTPASPFFACMQLKDKRRFEKTFVLQKNLSLWTSEVALPFIPAPCSGVVRSYCLGVWFGKLEVNGLPDLQSSCHPDDSVVWRSIFRSERTLPCWGSFQACQWPGELEMQHRKQHTLYAFFLMMSLWDDFFQTFQCSTNFWICFSWSMRQGKVIISKSVSIFW